MVYLPVCYDGKEKRPLNYPFLLGLDGAPKYFLPDTTRKQKLHLTRKYSWKESLHRFCEHLKDVVIEASSDVSFREQVDTIRLESIDRHLTGKVDSKKPYRYVRMWLPKNVRCAELEFIDSHGERVNGEVDSVWIEAFDGDPLTTINTFNALCERTEVVVNFEREVLLSEVVVLPASDGNGVYPGDTYELFYYDLAGWKSLGKRVATEYFLDYEDVPTGALFWLHNWSRGQEERVFTVDDEGKIRFW